MLKKLRLKQKNDFIKNMYTSIQPFGTLFNIILKKKFFFLTDSLKSPHPLNGQILLSVTSFFDAPKK